MLSSALTQNTHTAAVTYEMASFEAGDAREDILNGLLSPQKYLNPKYFYDQRGSELFEAITHTPEYYPTRTERQLLQRHAADIAAWCRNDAIVLEPGSGSCEKVRLLLEAIHPRLYVPMDISGEFLRQSALKLAAEYPWLKVRAICSDFSGESLLPQLDANCQKVVFYPGSTIGNMSPDQALAFLQRLSSDMQAGDLLILGVDLRKDPAILNAAYNDAQGITAEFNRNILNHVNHITGSDFNVADFSHQAFFNEADSRIEMHLISRKAQVVHCGGREVHFSRGETIHTENSCKYSLEEISELAANAGFLRRQSWLDDGGLFSVNLLEVSG